MKYCPECGHESLLNGVEYVCKNQHIYNEEELLSKEPESYLDIKTQEKKYIGEIKQCPSCNKKRKTSCTACGCGSCLSCGYRFRCLPIIYRFGTPLVVGKIRGLSSSSNIFDDYSVGLDRNENL